MGVVDSSTAPMANFFFPRIVMMESIVPHCVMFGCGRECLRAPVTETSAAVFSPTTTSHSHIHTMYFLE